MWTWSGCVTRSNVAQLIFDREARARLEIRDSFCLKSQDGKYSVEDGVACCWVGARGAPAGDVAENENI